MKLDIISNIAAFIFKGDGSGLDAFSPPVPLILSDLIFVVTTLTMESTTPAGMPFFPSGYPQAG